MSATIRNDLTRWAGTVLAGAVLAALLTVVLTALSPEAPHDGGAVGASAQTPDR